MQLVKTKIIFLIITITMVEVLTAPTSYQSSQENISEPKLNYNSQNQYINDINKKEAPRITDSEIIEEVDEVVNLESNDETNIVRTSRSANSNDLLQSDSQSNTVQSKSLIEGDDLEVAGSGYYRDNEQVKGDFSSNNFGELLNSNDDSPKIIGVRVTSSVAIARGQSDNLQNNNHQIQDSNNEATIEGRKIKTGSDVNRFIDDSPTTWRPLHYRPFNQDYYKGVPSNRHTVSAEQGANPDFILQQRRRDLLRKKQEIMHPYQRAVIYQNQRPRSFSYSSILNKFAGNNFPSTNTWDTSTQGDATESSAGYVTIINHNDDVPDNSSKNDYDIENKVNEEKDQLANSNNDNIHHVQPPPVPHVYSEPAKIYSEPAKIYSEPAKVYSEPAKVYGEPSKVYSEPAKVYGEPSKVYSQPATVYPHAFPSDHYNPHNLHTLNHPTQNPDPDDFYKNIFMINQHHQNNDTNLQPGDDSKRTSQQNYEVDEDVNVTTNGRTHGVQEKPDDGKKVGYVVEGRNYRKYRVEERTSDGFIVGEYGVVSHDDGSLRGVRYTADGTTNPRLIHDALMKFLSL